ncbi:MAG: YHS domain-containing (seleno)protein [Planctomycetota bacterium]|nr:YHS domain-containing (seleno)protein [Planctomycetota bacterium]
MSRQIVVGSLVLMALATAGCQSVRPGRAPVAAAGVGGPVEEKFLVNVDERGVTLNGGHDPVAFFTQGKPVLGTSAHRSVYRGAIYHFASAENKAMFDAAPERYEPQFGGYCAYAASIDRVSPIDVKYFEIIDGRLILQHNKKAWDLWHQEPAQNLVRADANWPGLVQRNGL